MADLKISQLSDGGNSQATDEYVIARSGANYRIDGASVAAAATSVGTLTSLTVSGAATFASSTGNVGIGTTSPVDTDGFGRALDIRSGSGGQVVIRDNDDTTKFARLAFDGGTTNIAYVGAVGSGTQLLFTAGGATVGRFDASGNLGLGVTPSAWGSAWNAIQLKNGVNLASYKGGGGSVPILTLSANAIDDGSAKYVVSDYATQYSQYNGQHIWYRAASGTAGNAITFTQAMTLDASGNLQVGTTTSRGRITAVTTGYSVLALGTSSTSSARGGAINFESEAPATRGQILYDTASDYMAFSTATTERLRIDASGNLGVGVSPSYKLHVATPSSGAGAAFRYTGGTNNPGLFIATTESTSVIDLGTSGSTGNTVLSFSTNGTERARITSGGTVLVGKATSDATTVGVEIGQLGEVYVTKSASTSADATYYLYSTGASAYRFYVDMAGTIFATSTTVSAISDARLKENIRDLDVGLDAILALKPRKYDWKEGKGQDKKDVRGFIAQEFEEVFPDLVDEWKDEAPEGEEPYRSVRQDLIPVLVKAIQELDAKNKALEARLEALEA